MTFDPVLNWYNVPFDAAMWIVLYLLMRGALDGIEVSVSRGTDLSVTHSFASKTLEDLANNELAEIKINPEMQDDPLCLHYPFRYLEANKLTTHKFLALAAKGAGFAKPWTTITAKGIAVTIRQAAISARLDGGGSDRFRRGTANFVSFSLSLSALII